MGVGRLPHPPIPPHPPPSPPSPHPPHPLTIRGMMTICGMMTILGMMTIRGMMTSEQDAARIGCTLGTPRGPLRWGGGGGWVVRCNHCSPVHPLPDPSKMTCEQEAQSCPLCFNALYFSVGPRMLGVLPRSIDKGSRPLAYCAQGAEVLNFIIIVISIMTCSPLHEICCFTVVLSKPCQLQLPLMPARLPYIFELLKQTNYASMCPEAIIACATTDMDEESILHHSSNLGSIFCLYVGASQPP